MSSPFDGEGETNTTTVIEGVLEPATIPIRGKRVFFHWQQVRSVHIKVLGKWAPLLSCTRKSIQVELLKGK